MGSIVTTNDYIVARLGLTAPTANELALIEAAIMQAEGAIKQYLGYDPVQRTRKEIYAIRDPLQGRGAGQWDINQTHAFIRRESRASALEIIVKHVPIRSITSMKVQYGARHGTITDAFPDDSALTEGVDFWPAYHQYDDNGQKVCTSGLIRSYGVWPSEAGSIEIEYTAGYSADELAGVASILDASAIAAAVQIEAARRALEAFQSQRDPRTGTSTGQITSERLGDYSYTVGGTSASSSGSAGNTLFGGINELLPETRTRLSGFVNYGYMLSA